MCHSLNIHDYHTDKRRHFYQCSQCKLVFASPDSLPNREKELSEYQLHENTFDDQGYVSFLSRPIQQARLHFKNTHRACLRALDFGCGPAPVLAVMLIDWVRQVDYFDPLFFPYAVYEGQEYDLITCTEAIEHFHRPAREWALLQGLLATNGVLIVMTKRVLSRERFKHWHYKNDPTHVSFFSEQTFLFMAKHAGMHVAFPTPDVAVFTKLKNFQV